MLMKESVTGLIAVSVQATSCSALQLFLLEAQSPLVTTTKPEAGEAVSTQEEKKRCRRDCQRSRYTVSAPLDAYLCHLVLIANPGFTREIERKRI